MQKIAVIGAGISGLSAAYLLKSNFQVTVYEKHPQLGGHAHTVTVSEQKRKIPIDVGFIVFNYATYPHLTKLFEALKVPIAKSNMSFGVSIHGNQIEYGSTNFNAWFAKRAYLINPFYWGMIRDILKFNKVSLAHLKNNTLPNISLGEYIRKLNLGKRFKRHYLLPMGAAIWSTSTQNMLDFPAVTFLNFFKNHGLLQITKPVQWYTVKGGSREYVNRLSKALKNASVQFAPEATCIERLKTKVNITDSSGTKTGFDKVIFANHPDEVLKILKNPTVEEQTYLGAIAYQPNKVILHTDSSFMPKRRAAWSSWVYLSDEAKDKKSHVSLSYWMNHLQPLDTQTQYFVTLNPGKEPKQNSIIGEYSFAHPQINQKAIEAQSNIADIQGQNRTFYCGAYLRYGFHEDGIHSAVKVAEALGVEIKW